MCTDVCLTDQRTLEAYSGGGYPVGHRSWPNGPALHDLLRYYEDVLSIDHHDYHPALTVDGFPRAYTITQFFALAFMSTSLYQSKANLEREHMYEYA